MYDSREMPLVQTLDSIDKAMGRLHVRCHESRRMSEVHANIGSSAPCAEHSDEFIHSFVVPEKQTVYPTKVLLSA